MIQAPPKEISLGGAVGAFSLPRPPFGGAGGPAGAPPSPQGAQGDPDATDVVGLLRSALANVQKAALAEKDDIDAASITKVASEIHALIANEQKLTDTVMGGGPGTKMIRKAQGSGKPASGSGY